jgi:hypothetical protein
VIVDVEVKTEIESEISGKKRYVVSHVSL